MSVSAIPIVNNILASISAVINLGWADERLQGEIEGSLRRLYMEVECAKWDLLKYEDVDPDLTLLMQDLLSDIEDFTLDLTNSERATAFFNSLMARDSCPFEIKKIEFYLSTMKSIEDRQNKLSEGNAAATKLASASSVPAPKDNLVGFPRTKCEFLKLLSPTHDGELKVICIVGSSGLGKTSLASAVYHDTSSTAEIEDPHKFQFKGWVSASMCNDTDELLQEIQSKLDLSFIEDKRYMVVIDDLWSENVHWRQIEHIFPKNGKNCRIIVTTRIQSIARKCSSGNYYVYPMKCLGEVDSAVLFWRVVFDGLVRDLSDHEVDRAKCILAKCAGSPMALISAGQYLCSRDRQPHLSNERCKEVIKELGHILETNASVFRELKQKLVQCYMALSNSDQKNCLLYFSMFPRGHQVNSKFVARKINAEALVSGDALECLDKLIDKSMLEPAEVLRHSCGVAKSCQTHGIMLEFVIDKSVSRNLVTIVDDKNVLHNKHARSKVRRLIIQSCSSMTSEDIELSAVRSLTIFCKDHLDTCVGKIDFKSCRMMRVLDLEGCKGLNMGSGSVFDSICELLSLKYLNLKNTDVDKVPTKIRNLKFLETLDIRQTSVSMLPVDVIMLPALVELFGEFELPSLSQIERNDLALFMKEKSNLKTLAGIIIQEEKSFEVVLRNAMNLRKIKIYGNKNTPVPAASATCRKVGFKRLLGLSRQRSANRTLPAPNGPPKSLFPPNANVAKSRATIGVLVSCLLERFEYLESISIDSSVISKFFLASDLQSTSITSIKLRGPLTSLAAFTFEHLRNLRKLHLFSTGLSSKQLVEVLQRMNRLEYLKLSEEDRPGSWEGDFIVESDGFPSLRELCFEGPKIYPRVMILEKAMRLLSSLQLLHNSPTGVEAMENQLVRFEGIDHLKYLNEVILHYSADDTTVSAWETALKLHPNMPCVKKQAQPAINNRA